MTKKILLGISVLIIDGIFSSIAFFLWMIAFVTMPALGNYDGRMSAHEVVQRSRDYFWDCSHMLFTEAGVCLVLIILTNYFILRLVFRRPGLITAIIVLLYVAFFWYQFVEYRLDYIIANMQ
ncbi:MAG: hypothetical protein ACJ77K_14415 [Bacteroidia bacterium]